MNVVLELGGFAMLVGALVEILKRIGFIPDGYAGLVAAIGNVVVFAVGAIGGVLNVDLATWDSIALALGELLLMVSGSFLTHKVGRAMNLPLFKK